MDDPENIMENKAVTELLFQWARSVSVCLCVILVVRIYENNVYCMV